MSVFSTPASSFIPTMPPRRLYQSCLFGLFALMAWVPLAWAGDRLLGTWGVSSVDGPGGGGLVPWATISGTGSDNQIGAAAYATRLATQGEYELRVVGAAVGIRDRLELNMARWSFKLGDVVPGKAIEMSSVGAKLRLVGNAVYDQDRKLPQISLGLQRKSVDDTAVARSLGAQHDHDVELYVTATKVWLGALWGRNVIGTVALRDTRANQFGLLGFGGPTDDSRHWRAEGSLGLMVNDGLVLGRVRGLVPLAVVQRHGGLGGPGQHRGQGQAGGLVPLGAVQFLMGLDGGGLGAQPSCRGWRQWREPTTPALLTHPVNGGSCASAAANSARTSSSWATSA
jgi:hypothetical protein